MNVYYLFVVLFGSLGIMCCSQVTQSAISQNTTSKFSWQAEESFHAHGPLVQITTSTNAEEEEDDEVNDEDEFQLKCLFSKKEISFIWVPFKESLISIHPKSRLLKPYLKPQFTPPDFILIT